MRVAVVLVALTGCDLAYGLYGRADPPRDSAVEDTAIDQPIDTIDAACPRDPTRMEDEDGDGFPNSCDNCPHVAQDDQLDADGDGTGDVCDPRQGAVDVIDYFDGFDAVPEELDLLPAGAWKIENGQLVAFAVPQLADRIARLRHDVGNAQVVTRLTLMNSNGDPESAGLWARLGPSAGVPAYPPGVVFEVLRNASGTVRGCHIVETYGVAAAVDCAQNQALFQTARPYTMSLDCTDGVAPECRGIVAYDAAGHVEVPIEWPNATRAMGAVGLRVYSIDTAFDYLVVIRHE